MAAPDFDKLKDSKDAGFGTRTWAPKVGENLVRVFPATSEQVDAKYGGGDEAPDHAGVRFREHFIKFQGDYHVFRCLRDFDQSCPACTFHFDGKESTDAAMKKLSDDFNNSIRFLMNVMDMEHPEKGIQPFKAAASAHNQLLTYISDATYGDCMSPEVGRTFVLERLKATPWYTARPHGLETSSVLSFLPDGWVSQLDGLEEAIPETWDTARIQALVDKARESVGMSPATPPMAATKAAATTPAQTAAPATVAAPAPAAEVVTSAPAAAPVPAPEAPATGKCPHGRDNPDECVDCRLAGMGLSK